MATSTKWLLPIQFYNLKMCLLVCSSFFFHHLAQQANLGVNTIMDISIAHLNKKRKFQGELPGMHLQKHESSDQMPEYDSFDSSTKKAKSIMYVEVDDTHTMSTNDGYCFDDDAAKLFVIYPKAPTSIESSITSASSSGTLSVIDPYSLESRSLKESSSSKLESSSMFDEVDNLLDADGVKQCHSYDEDILECGSYGDCSCLECQKGGFQDHTEKEFDGLLNSSLVAPCNYVLSSGRWTVNQDAARGARKLTIDKEFEQYFSMLML